MAHQPETPEQYVCEQCQITHAGTPVHVSGSDHRFDPPDACGGCGASSFVELSDWIHHHE